MALLTSFSRDPLMPVRIMLGLLYLPHWFYKILRMEASARFFESGGFHPGTFFLYVALVMEIACAIGFIFNIQTKWLGLVSAGVMGFAGIAVFNTKGVGWLWNLGGVEYLFFWGFCSVVVAADAWRREWQVNGKLSLFGTPRYA